MLKTLAECVANHKPGSSSKALAVSTQSIPTDKAGRNKIVFLITVLAFNIYENKIMMLSFCVVLNPAQ